MIRIYLPGQKVPNWLAKVEPKKGLEYNFNLGSVRFGSLVFVWGWKGCYIIANAGFAFKSVVIIKNCENVNIIYQSPANGDGGIRVSLSVFSALGL